MSLNILTATNGGPVVGDEANNLQHSFMAGLKWTAAFPLPDLDRNGANLDIRLVSCLRRKKDES